MLKSLMKIIIVWKLDYLCYFNIRVLIIFLGSEDKETIREQLNALRSAGAIVYLFTTLDYVSKDNLAFNGGKMFTQVNDATTRVEIMGKIYSGIGKYLYLLFITLLLMVFYF